MSGVHGPSPSALLWPSDEALVAALCQWLPSRRWFPSSEALSPECLRIVGREVLASDVHIVFCEVFSKQPSMPPFIVNLPLVLVEGKDFPVDDQGSGFLIQGASDSPVDVRDHSPRECSTVIPATHHEVACIDGAFHPAFWDSWLRTAVTSIPDMCDHSVENSRLASAPNASRGCLVSCYTYERVLAGEQSNTSVLLRRQPAPPQRHEETAAGYQGYQGAAEASEVSHQEPNKPAAGPHSAGAGSHEVAEGALALPERVIAKIIRIVSPGANPDVEIPLALAGSGWGAVPTLIAWSTARLPGGWTHTVSAAAFIEGAEDAFTVFCRLAASAQPSSASPPAPGTECTRGTDPSETRSPWEASVPRAGASVPSAGESDVPSPGESSERNAWEASVRSAWEVGALTGQMHERLRGCLGQGTAPTGADLAAALRVRAEWALRQAPSVQQAIPQVAQGVEVVLSALEKVGRLGHTTRIHGDYHLGQLLCQEATTGERRWFVVDFEGEPLRPLRERTTRDQPLRDVAGMLRSFDYAAFVGKTADPAWLPAVRGAFLQGYASVTPTHLRQADEALVLRALELDKALYEAAYEAANRPQWMGIPLAAIRTLLPPCDATEALGG